MFLVYIVEWPSISRIKNSIKPNRVRHILRHIYYATMQKLFNAKVIKATHRRSNFSETFVSQEIFVRIGFRKKSALKFPKFWVWKMLLVFLA